MCAGLCLSTVGCTCRRLQALASEPAVWRDVLSRHLATVGWDVSPAQLPYDLQPLRRMLGRKVPAWRPPRIALTGLHMSVVDLPSSLSTSVSARLLLLPAHNRLAVSRDGTRVRFTSERLGGNRAVRIEPALATKPHATIRAIATCPGDGAVRFETRAVVGQRNSNAAAA